MNLKIVLLLLKIIYQIDSTEIVISPSQIRNIDLAIQSTDNSGYVTLFIAEETQVKGYNVCSDNLSLFEANVVCHDMKRGMAHNIAQYPPAENTEMLIFFNHSKCFGHELSLGECVKVIQLKEVNQCKSASIFGLRCVGALPNLIADVETLERSVYIHSEPIYHLKCALEEKCLHDEAVKKYGNFNIEQLSKITDNNQLVRKLLRFSSIIKNTGDTAFLPHLSPESWQWHSCHGHYHSMNVFAVYQIYSLSTNSLDENSGLLLTGHKASFCLEDNVCVDGVKTYFKCSRNKTKTGNQGISPGCSDTYLHDIDCQWIDVTLLSHGRYIFRMVINPQLLVAESDYYDNAIVCELYYFSYYTGFHYCHLTHPLNFW